MTYIKQVNPQFYHTTTAANMVENGAKQFWLSIYDLPQVEKCDARPRCIVVGATVLADPCTLAGSAS